MLNKILSAYTKTLRLLVNTLIIISGLSVLAMITITCIDVVARRFGITVVGAYDLARIFSMITLACALPYTTAVKGHVAIEFFFHKLGRKSRLVVDTVMRTLSVALFILFTIRSFTYGNQLKMSGQVTQTIQIPVYWLAYVISFCSLVVTLVIAYSLFRPNKELVKL